MQNALILVSVIKVLLGFLKMVKSMNIRFNVMMLLIIKTVRTNFNKAYMINLLFVMLIMTVVRFQKPHIVDLLMLMIN